MIKKMSKKTLLWTSAVSLVLCVAMVISMVAMIFVGGGTNRITTANLDLELWKHNGSEYVDISDGTGDIFTGGKDGVVWEPGKIELAFLQVKNTGSSDVSFSVTQDVQLAKAADLPTDLTYAVVENMSYEDYSAANMETWRSIQKKATAQGNVVLGSTMTSSDVVLAAGESSYLMLAVHMDDKAEAAYEGITFDVTLSGKQLGGEIEEQTVFYVSPNGHDGNPGTEDEPLKSMRRVSQLAKPGQTYIFEDGTYNEGAMTVMMNSGTEEAPITIKARNPGKALIVYPESLCGTDCFQIKNKEYITIEGFDITQAVMADDSHPNANMDILIRVAGCNNITFRNNTLHGALEEPLKVAGCSGLLIEGNYIYNSGCEAIDFVNVCDSIVRNNTCEDIGRIALMCKGGSRSNLFYGNYIVNKNVKGQWAMQLGGATDNVSTWGCTTDDWEAFNCYAFNNVIVAQDNGSWENGLGFMGAKDCGFFNNVVIGAVIGLESRTANNETVQWEWSPTVNNPVVKNNIFMNCKRAAYNLGDEPVNPDFDYNLFYGNAGTDPKEEHSIYNKDPMFVADKSDWHLKAGSPAIGAGAAIGEQKGLSGQTFFVAFDKDYILRGDTWDMGVYDVDGTEKYEPGGLVFQDPEWLREIDHTIYEAPEVGSMPEAGTVLIEEDFETTTNLDAWIQCARSKGQWTIKNGLLQMVTTELEGHAIAGIKDGLEWSDYEFSATVLSPSKNGPSSGIVFRADEALENMYGFRFHPESGGEQLEFCVWNNDKFASIKYLKFDWSTNKLYDLKVIAVGNEFEFYVNDKKIGTATDSTHPVGTAAVYSFRESRMFDNIVAKSARGYQVVQMQEVEEAPQYTGKILYEEDFSSSDAIKDWKQYSGGEWKVDGGIMSVELGVPGENITIYEGGYDWVNYEFTCDVRQPEKGGMWAGLIFRCNDNKTGYYGFRFVNDNTQVVKGWPGSWTQMGTKAMSSLPKGEVAELKVIVIDDTFRLYLNGMKVWEDDDKMYKKGSIGLFQQNMTEVIFDNIVVKEIASDGVEVEPEVDTTPTGKVVYSEDFSKAANADRWINLKGESGEFSFKDGQLKFKQTGDEEGSSTYYADGYWKNYTMVLNMTLPDTYSTNGWFQIFFRTSDCRDGSYIYLMNLTNSDRLRIVDTKNGLLKEVVGGAVTSYHDGKEHEVKIKVKDNTVEVLIDDWSVVTFQSDKLTTDPGSIGFAAYNNEGYMINDIKIYCDDNPILEKPAPGEEVDAYVPDGKLVVNESMDAASDKWEVMGAEFGTYTYKDGKAVYTQIDKGSGGTLLYKDGYWKNFTLMFDATFPRTDKATGWLRIGLRTSDGQDKPFAYFQNLSRDYLKINERLEEINLTYGGNVSKFHDGNVHKVRIEVKDNTIDIYVDETLMLSTKDERIIAEPGTISFTTFGNGYTFDNVKVYTTDDPILEKPESSGNGDVESFIPTYNKSDLLLKEDFADALDSGWKNKGSAEYTVEDGKLTIKAAGINTGNYVWYTSATSGRWADYDIYVKMSAPSEKGRWNGIIFRSTSDAASYYQIRFLNGLVQFGSNSASDIKNTSNTLAIDGKYHNVQISVRGTTVKVYIDTKLIYEAEGVAITGGTVGFGAQGVDASFDDLYVIKAGALLDKDPNPPAETPSSPGDVFDPSTDTITGDEIMADELAVNGLSNWTVKKTGGAYTYSNGALAYSAATDTLFYENGSWTNFTVTFKVTPPVTSAASSWLRVQLRTTTGGDGAYVYFQNLGTDYIKIVNGSNATLKEVKGSGTADFFNGKEHYVKIVVEDTTVSLFVDGKAVASATDSSLTATAGSVAFISYGHSYSFKDLKIYNQDAPGSNEPTTPPATEPEDVLYENDFSNALESGWKTSGIGNVSVENGGLKLDATIANGNTSKITRTWYTSEATPFWEDYEMTVKMTVPDAAGKWTALMLRASDDASKYYYLQFINGIIQLRTQSGTTLQTARFTYDTNVHDVKIVASGNTLKVYYDDALKITATDASIAAGGVGFLAENMVATFDDLKVVNKGEPVVVKTDIVVSAQFNDNNNALNNRITEFGITLNGNGTNYPATLKAGDNWTYTFSVPKYNEQGNEITYTLGTPTVSGYRSKVEDGTKVVLDPLTSFSGTVVWNHDDNAQANWPATIKVTLMRGAAVVDTKRVTEGAFVFENLDQFYDGAEAVYTVMVATDDVPTNYKVNVSNGTVNVSYIPEAMDVDVEILFDDGDDLDGKRPESVKVTVTGKKGTEPYSSSAYEVTKAAGWKNKLSLRKSHGGVDITYTLSVAAENLPEGYTAVVNGYTVTLKHVPETVVLLDEDFSDSNAINNWTELAAGADNGEYTVVDGKLKFTYASGSTGCTLVYNQISGVEDLELSFKMTMPSSRTWNRILLRNNGTSPGAGILVNFYNFTGSNRLIRIFNGNTKLTEVSVGSLLDGEVHDVKISLIGNVLKVYVDDVLKVDLTDDRLLVNGGGTIGFQNYGYSPVFDDVKLIDKTNYTVTWDVDGVQTPETYMAGKTPAFIGSTDKAEDAANTYTFAGWDSNNDGVADEIQRVTKNVTYKALYTVTPK